MGKRVGVIVKKVVDQRDQVKESVVSSVAAVHGSAMAMQGNKLMFPSNRMSSRVDQGNVQGR